MKKVLFIFGQLNDDDVEWIARAGERRFVAEGAELIRQGVPADAIFIALEGTLAVVLGGHVIAELGAGEIVGEMSFVDARPPSATVRGLEQSTVFAIPRSRLEAKLEEDMGFAARFYRALAIYLSNSLRERHRAAGFGDVEMDDAPEQLEEDELDENVLDNVSLAGERFERLLKSSL